MRKARVLTLALSSVLLGAPSANASDETPRALSINYQEGQLVTIAAPIDTPGEVANSIRRNYFDGLNAIAIELGLSYDGTLAVEETVAGDFSPSVIAFLSWPNVEAEENLIADANWPTVKSQRPNAWDELHLYTMRVERPLELLFSEDHFYSLFVSWPDADNSLKHEEYLDFITTDISNLGGRVMLEIRAPRFEAIRDEPMGPDRVVFVEWDRREDMMATFDSSRHTPFSGLARFDAHMLVPRFPPPPPQ